MNSETPKTSNSRRTEIVLGIIAGLMLAALLGMVVLCLPYFGGEAQSLSATEAPTETTVPPTTEETEPPTEPTIPPDLNPLGRHDFQYNRNNYLLLSHGESTAGVDVSAFQGNIDWQAVADSGIEFAMIRLGYRGYGQKGTLVEDEYAKANLKGAKEAGLDIGAYFFSQALTVEEVEEEIDFMLNTLGDTELDMPIVFDWEYISETARTANMDANTLTWLSLQFCLTMEEKGYQPMVYFNWHQSSKLLYLHDLEAYPFWLALYSDRMTYPYKVEMWQYTNKGRVPGIQGDVDINVYMPNP